MNGQEKNPRVIAEFKTRQRRQWAVTLPIIAAVFFLLWLADHGGSIGGISCSSLGVPSVAVVAGLVIFSLQNWRCPACNGYLGKAISPRFCSKCGAALQ